jgi:predicted transposase YbfD/YdcC
MPNKDHEIQAAQRLIEALGLSGRLYTFDALHLQKKPSKP